ncbi:hypothetical protein [Mucilaginibacter pineti]|nr:hypothetical protein [Mucilaginibacter pineti]
MNLNNQTPGNLLNANGTPYHKSSSAYLKVMLTLMFTCLLGTAMAQWRSHGNLTYGGGGNGASNFDSGLALSFGAAYDAPLGDFGQFFKPAVNYNVSLLNYFEDFTVGLTLGYHSYKPKDQISYDTGDATDGTTDVIDISVAYKNFKVYSAYLSGVYNINLADDFRVYLGANLGTYHTQSAFSYIVDDVETTSSTSQTQLYTAPKLGVTFPVSSSFGISVETKYNVFFAGSSADGSSFGSSVKTFSGGVNLNFKL